MLYTPRIIAAACFVLAQHLAEGSHSAGLDARIAATPAAASLPTPPTHKPASPDAYRVALEYYRLTEADLRDAAGKCYTYRRPRSMESSQASLDALCVILEFYRAQDLSKVNYLGPILTVRGIETHTKCV